jgi:hypothetical protein
VPAETVRVSGTVTNPKDGNPLPGVMIMVKERPIGATTDRNGNFSLNVPSDAILLFSSAGMITQEISVDNRPTINVVMEAEDIIASVKSKLQQLSGIGNFLYIVNGKEVDCIGDIPPVCIKSITILRDRSAIEQYGEKAKNGVMIITLREIIITIGE